MIFIHEFGMNFFNRPKNYFITVRVLVLFPLAFMFIGPSVFLFFLHFLLFVPRPTDKVLPTRRPNIGLSAFIFSTTPAQQHSVLSF